MFLKGIHPCRLACGVSQKSTTRGVPFDNQEIEFIISHMYFTEKANAISLGLTSFFPLSVEFGII
jgi:hypothetical protein